MQKQQGFLSMVAVVLILLTGFVAVSAMHAYSSEINATVENNLARQAFFAAEAGMRRASYYLLAEDESAHLSCVNSDSDALVGDVSVTDASLNGGDAQFTVTNQHPSGSLYQASSAVLSTSVSNSDNTFNVNSTTGYASSGFFVAGQEVVQYSGITASSFTGLTRGVMGTAAAAHASATTLSQKQCSLLSTGVVKDFSNPLAKRSIAFDIVFIPVPDGWAVGKDTGGDARVARFNKPTAGGWNYQLAAGIDKELKSVSIVNKDLGWAVGKKFSSPKRFNIVRWDGSSWSEIASADQPSTVNDDFIVDLDGVSAVSDHDVWAVGKGYKKWWPMTPQYIILHYNGTKWCVLGAGGDGCSSIGNVSASDTNNDLKAVHIIDTNNDGNGDFGFAVGKNAKLVRFNGSWTDMTLGGDELKGVFVVSTSEAWAVGKKNSVWRWNGGSWAKLHGSSGLGGISGDPEWRSVYMLDTNGDGRADDGWMVGKSDNAARYSPASGGQWTNSNTSGMGNLNGVSMFSSNDVWAVADGGDVTHWDGSNWTRTAPPNGANQNLKAISLIMETMRVRGNWRELFA